MSRDNQLDLEKQNIGNRLQSLEDVVTEALSINKKFYMKVYGDPEANPPIDGIETRLKKLETIEKEREKNKDILIKTALGSVTIAVGAIMLWIFTVLKDAFFGHK